VKKNFGALPSVRRVEVWFSRSARMVRGGVVSHAAENFYGNAPDVCLIASSLRNPVIALSRFQHQHAASRRAP
jgi:hypothetical protein